MQIGNTEVYNYEVINPWRMIWRTTLYELISNCRSQKNERSNERDETRMIEIVRLIKAAK